VKFFRRLKKGGKGSAKVSAKLSARAKGKTTKPKGKARAGKDEEEAESAPISREIPGLILLALVLVTFIALISEFVQAEGNLLGPWLGSWWASALSSAFGGFPILIYLGALGLLGVQWTFDRAGWRPVVITTSIAFLLGLLLSIQHLGAEGLIRAEYQVSGGWVGNFLAQQIFLPVFGAGKFGPYFVTSLLIFILVVWVFQISVAAWVKRGAFAAGAVSRTIADGWRSAERPDAADYEIEEEDEDEGFIPATPLKAARAPRGARGRKADAGIVAGADEDLIPTAADTPEEEKAKLTALLERGSLEGLDPLTIRKLRDLEQERQRVTELNDWEEKTRDTEIGGLLGRKAPPAKPEKVPAKSPAAAVPAEDLDLPELDLDSGFGDSEDADIADIADDGDDFDTTIEDADDFPTPAPKKKMGKGRSAPAKSLANRAPWDGADDGEGEGRIGDDGSLAPSTVVYDPYHLPDLDTIFPTPPVQALEFTEEELLEQKQLLEAQLNNFKVRGKVTGIHPGPVITRYEVELAPGEKVNRISGLSDDLALALRAKSIRILAPIPGKSLVGVEVPNRKAQIVYIKEILTSDKFLVEKDSLKVALGKTISGDPYVADLTRAPHLLIAGQTGSGKSVCINSIMASLLASKSPGDLRMILVDPKVVELKPYENIPHLLGPVITKPEDAVQALKWATLKMDERYDKLAKSGVRNIKGFNEKVRAGTIREEYRYSQSEEFGDGVVVRYTDDEAAAIEAADGIVPSGEEMPYILIVIDELADLMMVAGKEVETNIARIAQKARAVGIHLILATQRPSTNVITGTIKANLPTRIAFQVASQIDARTILDRQGAEKLLGRGDMLFRPIESPEPERLHGCFIDDPQCESIAEECARQNVNYPKVRTFNVEEEMAGGHDPDQERDEKFIDAAELVVQLKQASVSLLQRRLGVGYAKAGRIVDQLERAGIVGRERGSKPREVLMNEEELYSFLRSHEATDGL
jgi:S-DNA-T family DNA segregation ATPase FtsK/SpoIIIE